jgi:hypothetical protein
MTRHSGTEEIPQLDDLLSMRVKDAVKISGISKDGLYALIRNGEILTFTMGARRFIVAESLTNYVKRRSLEPLSIRPGPKQKRGRELGPPAQPSAKV